MYAGTWMYATPMRAGMGAPLMSGHGHGHGHGRFVKTSTREAKRLNRLKVVSAADCPYISDHHMIRISGI